jgi:hypothetical protein
MKYAVTPGNSVIKEGQPLSEWLINYGNRCAQSSYESTVAFGELLHAIAEVATNGFTPEPGLARFEFHVPPSQSVTVAPGMGLKIYQQPAAQPKPPARPFIGSHNLPYDSDWDG